MALFPRPTAGTAGHGSSGVSVSRLQPQASGRIAVPDEDSTASSNTPNSKAGARSSEPPRRCGNVDEHPIPTANPGQTAAVAAAAAAAEYPPLESKPELAFPPQGTSQNADKENASQHLAKLVDPRASHGTRVSTQSSEEEDSSIDSCGDDANSDYTELISDDESDTEDVHQYVVLGAYTAALEQPMFFLGTCDTGAAVSILSHAKARLVDPDGVSNDLPGSRKRILSILGSEVTVHGPIWVKFWLGSEGSRIRYKAPFYILPSGYRQAEFDALLNIKVVQRLGLVEIQRKLAV